MKEACNKLNAFCIKLNESGFEKLLVFVIIRALSQRVNSYKEAQAWQRRNIFQVFTGWALAAWLIENR